MPRGIYGVGCFYGKSLDVACHDLVFPEGEPDNCCNRCDFDEDGVCGNGYVQLSHSGTRRYGNWTNNKHTLYRSLIELNARFCIYRLIQIAYMMNMS